MKEFDAKQYWEDRLQGNYDLHGVGLIEWGELFNQWLYRIRRRDFFKTIKAIRADCSASTVLDIGSGTGFYLECWTELGALQIHGMDLTNVAVKKLQKKFVNMTVHCGDIGESPLQGLNQNFDIISCMDVLFHIVDDDKYQQAFKNIAYMLKFDGVFIFSDSWLKGDDVRGIHIVHRSRKLVDRLLKEAGLEVIDVHPMFILMNAPVDSQNPILKFWWWSLYQVTARFHRLGGFLARVLYPLEILLLSLLRNDGPTTKVIVCRKRAE